MLCRLVRLAIAHRNSAIKPCFGPRRPRLTEEKTESPGEVRQTTPRLGAARSAVIAQGSCCPLLVIGSRMSRPLASFAEPLNSAPYWERKDLKEAANVLSPPVRPSEQITNGNKRSQQAILAQFIHLLEALTRLFWPPAFTLAGKAEAFQFGARGWQFSKRSSVLSAARASCSRSYSSGLILETGKLALQRCADRAPGCWSCGARLRALADLARRGEQARASASSPAICHRGFLVVWSSSSDSSSGQVSAAWVMVRSRQPWLGWCCCCSKGDVALPGSCSELIKEGLRHGPPIAAVVDGTAPSRALLLPSNCQACSEIWIEEKPTMRAKWESGSGSGVGCSSCRSNIRGHRHREIPRSRETDPISQREAGSRARIAGTTRCLARVQLTAGLIRCGTFHHAGPSGSCSAPGCRSRSGRLYSRRVGPGGVRKAQRATANVSALSGTQLAIKREKQLRVEVLRKGSTVVPVTTSQQV